MARDWDEKKRIEYISGVYEERKQIDMLVNNMVCSLKKAFALSKRERSLRDISQETGISISALSGLFQYPFHGQNETNQTGRITEKKDSSLDSASGEQEEVSTIPTDGPWMINIARIAKTLDIAIPSLFEFDPETTEYLPSYEQSPNSWDVLVQNMRVFDSVVRKMARGVYKKVGGVSEEYRIKKREEKETEKAKKEKEKQEGKTEEEKKKERKRYEIPTGLDSQADKVRNLAKDFTRYYERIVYQNTKDTGKERKPKNSNIYPEELLGNSKCELKTVVTVTKRLKPEWDLRKWFSRWCGEDITDQYDELQDAIAIYKDEEEKTALIAPYVIAGSQDLLSAIRVGSPKEMEEKYSAEDILTAFGIGKNATISPAGILYANDKGLYKEVDWYPERPSSWKSLFDLGLIQEGDFLIAFATKEFDLDYKHFVVYNLTRVSAETIREELKEKTIRVNTYKCLNITPIKGSRCYRLIPDEESREELSKNDPLWIYHSENDQDNYKFICSEFALKPSDYFSCYPDFIVKSEETEYVVGFDRESWIKRALKESVSEKQRREGKDTGRTVRFNRGFEWDNWKGNLALVPTTVVYIDAIGLYRVEKHEYTYPGKTIIRYEAKDSNPLAEWTLEALAAGVADKAGRILEQRGYTADFIEAYKERIRNRGVEELLKTNRLWIEVKFQSDMTKGIYWNWKIKWPNPVK